MCAVVCGRMKYIRAAGSGRWRPSSWRRLSLSFNGKLKRGRPIRQKPSRLCMLTIYTTGLCSLSGQLKDLQGSSLMRTSIALAPLLRRARSFSCLKKLTQLRVISKETDTTFCALSHACCGGG